MLSILYFILERNDDIMVWECVAARRGPLVPQECVSLAFVVLTTLPNGFRVGATPRTASYVMLH